MLTEQIKLEIQGELAQYETKRSAAADALKIVQSHFGYVSDEHLAQAAEILGMTAEELDSIATFYNLIYRRPVGKHVILICDSVSCWIMGYPNIKDYLLTKLGITDLGMTSADGMFTLLPVPCLGACDKAPAMMIGDKLYGNLTNEKIDAILKEYQK